MPDFRNHGEEIEAVLGAWQRPIPCPLCGSFASRCSFDDDAGVSRCGITGEPMPGQEQEREEPAHRPLAPDAPIPGRHHYAGCDPDGATVAPDGVCRGCGGSACPDCGFEVCSCRLSPEDLLRAAESLSQLDGIDEGSHTDSMALRRLEALLRREAGRR